MSRRCCFCRTHDAREPEPHKAAGKLVQPGRLRGLTGGISVDARFRRRPSPMTQIIGHISSGQQQELSPHPPASRAAGAGSAPLALTGRDRLELIRPFG